MPFIIKYFESGEDLPRAMNASSRVSSGLIHDNVLFFKDPTLILVVTLERSFFGPLALSASQPRWWVGTTFKEISLV